MSIVAPPDPPTVTLYDPTLDEFRWFAGKSFSDLFAWRATARKALRIFGLEQRRFIVGYGWIFFAAIVALAALALALSQHLAKKNASKCFTIDVSATHPITSLPLGSGIGTLCPMQSAQLPWGWSDLLDPSRWLDLAERLVTSDFPQIFSSFGIVAALWLASYQWSVTRRHGAFSESFERKAASNGIIMGNAGPLGPFIRAARTESAEADEKKEERKIVQDVFVYMELDNLEYVFEKYRDREISARSTLRQCFIFVSRCKVPEFRDKAWDSAKLGYYRPEFRDAVWNLALFSQTKEVTVPHSNLLQRFVRKVKDAVSRWRSVSVETTGAPEK